jgi:tetratricopeptide (TPR) repeat protein
MWPRFILLFCLSAASALAIPRADTRDVLKRLASLPSFPAPQFVQYHPLRGFSLAPDSSDGTSETTGFREKLKGNAQDAEAMLKLAQASAKTSNLAAARRQFLVASVYFRQRLKIDPSNGSLWLQFSEALAGSESWDEARHALAQGKANGAETKALSMAEARLAQMIAWKTIEPRLLASEATAAWWDLSVDELGQDELESVESNLDAAARACDQAVSADSKDAEVYLLRANFHLMETVVRRAIHAMKSGAPVQERFELSALAKADFQKAFELHPSPVNQVLSFFVLGTDLTVFRREVDPRSGLDRFGATETGLALARRSLALLERESEANDPEKASIAAECLGILQRCALRDESGAEASFRKAARLQPERDRPWNLLASVLIETRQYAELVNICQERSEIIENVRSRLALAKACELAGMIPESELAVAEAFSLNSNDFFANLAVANALLRRSDGETYMEQVKTSLSKAAKAAHTAGAEANLRELAITESIYYGMSGNPDKARSVLLGLGEKARELPRVQEILEELGYGN